MVVDDGLTVTVFLLAPHEASRVLPRLPAPPAGQLLSERLVGLLQRTPDGYVVWSDVEDGTLYAPAPGALSRALCAALGLRDEREAGG